MIDPKLWNTIDKVTSDLEDKFRIWETLKSIKMRE